MTTIRLLIYRNPSPTDHAFEVGRCQPDGTKRWPLGTLTVITLKRGGWLRAIWQAWRDR